MHLVLLAHCVSVRQGVHIERLLWFGVQPNQNLEGRIQLFKQFRSFCDKGKCLYQGLGLPLKLLRLPAQARYLVIADPPRGSHRCIWTLRS